MKAFITAALAAVALASTADVVSAQYGDIVPIRPNYRGEASCPSNYVIRDGVCVSIYAGRGYDSGYRRYRHRYSDDDDAPRATARPWINRRGELQCPSNYVLQGDRLCVSIY
jgi:hypothetical protein